jgi:hypothetical protein
MHFFICISVQASPVGPILCHDSYMPCVEYKKENRDCCQVLYTITKTKRDSIGILLISDAIMFFQEDYS